jgi:hypothetical protein
MGAWGVEIFEDDVACDTRLAIYDLFQQGMSVKDATDAVLDDLGDMLADEEDGPVVILALAAAQWEAGRLDPRIKKRALKIIEQGVDFRWRDNDEFQEKRRQVLQALGAKLQSPPPAPRALEELGE